ncbi:MAG TPA: hypothetical protein VG733_17800, partial [Chthoniobacteraceae bacterium]|nr:hypothetical protein [Chthoniobacteraceae bacterium]
MSRETAAPSFTHCVRLLHRRIVLVRARRLFIRSSTGIAASLALFVGVIAAEALLDDLVDLPWFARAVILSCNIAGAGWLCWRDCVQPLRKRPNDDAIALMVENAMPVFQTRFIASIQLARATSADAPHALV